MAHQQRNEKKYGKTENPNDEQKWIEQERKKILTIDQILAVPVQDCHEPLVKLSDAGIYTNLTNNDTAQYTGQEIYLRVGIVRDLEQINKELAEYHLEFMCTYGWRHPDVQAKNFHEELVRIQAEFPSADENEQIQRASIYAAHPSVASHLTGAALDGTFVDKQTKQPLDMGCAIDENSGKMWRFTPFLTNEQKRNRQFLNEVFSRFGYFLYPGEWWHVSKGDRESVAYMKNKLFAIYGPILDIGA